MADNETAQKRQWLRENGYAVGSRGKLSAEHEQAYAAQTPAQPPVPVQPTN